jgi:Zn-dependent protease
MPHIRREPFGMVILPLGSALLTGFPFGYASAPFDPEWARRHPERAAWMALAGPAANIALVIIAALLLRIGALSEVFYAPERVNFGSLAASQAGEVWEMAAALLSVVFSMNLLLAAFNLLPFPPLDGSAALPLLLSRRVSARYQEFMWSSPMIGLLGILIAWQLFDHVFDPIFLAAVNLVYPGVTYH